MRSTKGEEPPGVRAELKTPLTPPPRPTGTGPSACHRATGPLRGGAGTTAYANRSASGALGGASAEWPALRPPRGLAPIRRRWRLRFHCQLKDAVSRAGLLGAPREGAWRFGLLPAWIPTRGAGDGPASQPAEATQRAPPCRVLGGRDF